MSGEKDLPPVDPARLAAECAADEEVLRSLAESGDLAHLPRLVDLHFKGEQAAIEALADDADLLALSFVQLNEHEDGEWSVDFQLTSTIERDTLVALTRRALQIEQSYGVDYDGWGCVAKTGPER